MGFSSGSQMICSQIVLSCGEDGATSGPETEQEETEGTERGRKSVNYVDGWTAEDAEGPEPRPNRKISSEKVGGVRGAMLAG